jgi:hypothetical protein
MAGNRSGYMTEGDILTHTIDGIDLNQLWGEFITANTVYNEHKQGFVGLLTYPVLSDIELVPQIGDFNFEVATEFGIPRGQNTNISYYQLAYAYQDYDLKLGYTWKFLRDAPSQQIEAIHTKAIQADQALVFRKTLWKRCSTTVLVRQSSTLSHTMSTRLPTVMVGCRRATRV